MSTIKPLRKARGGHSFSLEDDDFCGTPTQVRYFAIGELNRRNTWNDQAFDAACLFLVAAWNSASKAQDQ